MKILILGATGLLGRHLQAELTGHRHDVHAFKHAEADITDSGRLGELFSEPWDAVVNCAAIVNLDACENDPESTGRTNLTAPLDLARRCHSAGALFVQFSSDYIFHGTERHLHTEQDSAEPLSVYGRQKLALERQIPGLCPRSLILRLSWLYGKGGRTFMSSIPQILASKPELRIASGKTGSCLWAKDAAHWIRLLLESNSTGLFNLVNSGETSWEEFARKCLDRMQALGLATACGAVIETPYLDLGTHGAKRPKHSALDPSKLSAHSPPGPRPWREALDAYLFDLKSDGTLRTA